MHFLAPGKQLVYVGLVASNISLGQLLDFVELLVFVFVDHQGKGCLLLLSLFVILLVNCAEFLSLILLNYWLWRLEFAAEIDRAFLEARRGLLLLVTWDVLASDSCLLHDDFLHNLATCSFHQVTRCTHKVDLSNHAFDVVGCFRLLHDRRGEVRGIDAKQR